MLKTKASEQSHKRLYIPTKARIELASDRPTQPQGDHHTGERFLLDDGDIKRQLPQNKCKKELKLIRKQVIIGYTPKNESSKQASESPRKDTKNENTWVWETEPANV